MKAPKKKKKKQDREVLDKIDNSILELKTDDPVKKERAARTLLRLFRPLILSTSKSISMRVPHSMDEILPIVENKLIKMASRYLTPRTDTQGEGRLIGDWSPNFNVYLTSHSNFYKQTKLEVMEDIDGPGRKARKYQGAANPSTQQYSVILDQEMHPEYQETFSYVNMNEVLDHVEASLGLQARELVMLKFIYRQRNPIVRWVLGMSAIHMKMMIDAVRDTLRNDYGRAIV